jgi:hypothetical protein
MELYSIAGLYPETNMERVIRLSCARFMREFRLDSRNQPPSLRAIALRCLTDSLAAYGEGVCDRVSPEVRAYEK